MTEEISGCFHPQKNSAGALSRLRSGKLGLVLGVASSVMLLQTARAQFTFPVYEPFQYPEGERLRTAGSSGTNWNFGNSFSSVNSPLITTNAALSYPGLLPDPYTDARGISTTTNLGRTHAATITPQTNGTIYASFLLALERLPTGDRAIFGLNQNSSGTPNPGSGASVWITPLGQLKVGKNNSTTPATNVTSALTVGASYFVVLAYTFQTNADQVDLWLNPTSLGNNGNVPPPTISTTNGNDNTSLQSICLYAPTGQPQATNLIDEIRVDNNWAGVTPNSCSPGTVYNVTGGVQSGCPGNQFPVGLSGSDLNVKYLLYTNGVLSDQVIDGTGSAVNFAPQSTTANYTVLASNTVSQCVGWMTGSATIVILQPPGIVTQPVPAIVATNGLAAFSVVASGTGLNYQWHKNGTPLSDGGHISGSTSPNLIILPAGTSDQATAANGYYVVITNNCGSAATSVTNGLTLDQAANLTWTGDGLSNVWDVAATPNWTNSAGNVAAFNYGDNVLFDDTSTNTVVNLSGNYLSPSRVVVDNTAVNYTIAGSGIITGPGSFVKTGFAFLTNRVANTYTGGTTISNGTLFIATPAAVRSLGPGTVTLAGGTLRFGSGLGFSGSAVAFSNNLNQVSDSTLEYNGTGSQGCNLLGSLNGTPGTMLTIFEPASAGFNRIRFYGGFTNSLNILFSSGGAIVQFAPYLTNGNQVYNGVISGIGQIVSRNGTNGPVMLNNGGNTFAGFLNVSDAGSFDGSLVLTAGSVGLGADSTSTTPPTIISGPIGTGPLVMTPEVPSASGAASGTLFASGGARTIHNPLNYRSGTNSFTLIIGGANNLTFAGEYNLAGIDGTITNRTIQVDNTALTTLAGVVSDGGLAGTLTKTGDGILVMAATNTYTGLTTVAGGTLQVNGQLDVGGVSVTNGALGGTGTILGPVTVEGSGALAPGASIGTLTINNDLTLGNVLIEVNKLLSPSNDFAIVSGVLTNTGGGTVGVINLGPALVPGDKFTIFNKPVQNGSALSVVSRDAKWKNDLEVDGSISVITLIPEITSTRLSAGGDKLIFSGRNGIAGNTYYVLSSTNLALPLADWTREFTNTFGLAGSFSVTNPISGSPQKFYLLQLQ